VRRIRGQDLGLTIISCTTVALPRPPLVFNFPRRAIGFYRRTTLIKYQRNLLFKLSLSANKRHRHSVGGGAQCLNVELTGGFCFRSMGAWMDMLYNKFHRYVVWMCAKLTYRFHPLTHTHSLTCLGQTN